MKVRNAGKYLSLPAGLLLICTFMLTLASTEAEAQTRVGIRGGIYTDTDEAFIGGELLTPIAPSWYFNPNLEFVTVDGGTFMTFNGDIHYDFPTRSSTLVWIGAGLAALYTNPDGPRDSQTDLGANLLFGVGFGRGHVIPYIQGKAILADNDEFVVGFGLRF